MSRHAKLGLPRIHRHARAHGFRVPQYGPKERRGFPRKMRKVEPPRIETRLREIAGRELFLSTAVGENRTLAGRSKDDHRVGRHTEGVFCDKTRHDPFFGKRAEHLFAADIASDLRNSRGAGSAPREGHGGICGGTSHRESQLIDFHFRAEWNAFPGTGLESFLTNREDAFAAKKYVAG